MMMEFEYFGGSYIRDRVRFHYDGIFVSARVCVCLLLFVTSETKVIPKDLDISPMQSTARHTRTQSVWLSTIALDHWYTRIHIFVESKMTAKNRDESVWVSVCVAVYCNA